MPVELSNDPAHHIYILLLCVPHPHLKKATIVFCFYSPYMFNINSIKVTSIDWLYSAQEWYITCILPKAVHLYSCILLILPTPVWNPSLLTTFSFLYSLLYSAQCCPRVFCSKLYLCILVNARWALLLLPTTVCCLIAHTILLRYDGALIINGSTRVGTEVRKESVQ